MVRAYSTDLRERVIHHVSQGNSAVNTAKLFNVAHSTVYSWLSLFRQTGGLQAKKCGSPAPRKIDEERLKQYFRDNPDATLHEAGRVFSVSHTAIDKKLRKLGITRKKNRSL